MRRSLLLLPLLLVASFASGGVITENPEDNLRPRFAVQLRPWTQVRPWLMLGPPSGLHAALGPGVERPGAGLPCLTVSAGGTGVLALGGCTPAR